MDGISHLSRRRRAAPRKSGFARSTACRLNRSPVPRARPSRSGHPTIAFIAFFAAGKLKKVDTRGRHTPNARDAAAGRGGAWNRDGVILFAGQANSPISRVSAREGPSRPSRRSLPIRDLHADWPQFLPDGRHFLYYQHSAKPEYQGIHVASLDSPRSTRVLDSTARAVYASGHLLFVRDGISSLRLSMTGRSGQAVNQSVLRMASATGWPRLLIRLSPRRAPIVLAYGPTSVHDSLRWHARAGDGSQSRCQQRVHRRACARPNASWSSRTRRLRSPISGCWRWPDRSP